MTTKRKTPSLDIRGRSLMETPCKDCEDREIGCHGKCEKYKEHQERCKEDRGKRFEAYAPAHLVDKYVIDGCNRRKRRR